LTCDPTHHERDALLFDDLLTRLPALLVSWQAHRLARRKDDPYLADTGEMWARLALPARRSCTVSVSEGAWQVTGQDGQVCACASLDGVIAQLAGEVRSARAEAESTGSNLPRGRREVLDVWDACELQGASMTRSGRLPVDIVETRDGLAFMEGAGEVTHHGYVPLAVVTRIKAIMNELDGWDEGRMLTVRAMGSTWHSPDDAMAGHLHAALLHSGIPVRAQELDVREHVSPARSLAHERRVIDIISRGANISTEEMVDVFERSDVGVAPLADSAEGAGVLMGALADMGRHGRSLRGVWRDAHKRFLGITPSSPLTREFEALGVRLFRRNGHLRDLTDLLIDTVRERVSDAHLIRLFGTRPGRAFIQCRDHLAPLRRLLLLELYVQDKTDLRTTPLDMHHRLVWDEVGPKLPSSSEQREASARAYAHALRDVIDGDEPLTCDLDFASGPDMHVEQLTRADRPLPGVYVFDEDEVEGTYLEATHAHDTSSLAALALTRARRLAEARITEVRVGEGTTLDVHGAMLGADIRSSQELAKDELEFVSAQGQVFFCRLDPEQGTFELRGVAGRAHHVEPGDEVDILHLDGSREHPRVVRQLNGQGEPLGEVTSVRQDEHGMSAEVKLNEEGVRYIQGRVAGPSFVSVGIQTPPGSDDPIARLRHLANPISEEDAARMSQVLADTSTRTNDQVTALGNAFAKLRQPGPHRIMTQRALMTPAITDTGRRIMAALDHMERVEPIPQDRTGDERIPSIGEAFSAALSSVAKGLETLGAHREQIARVDCALHGSNRKRKRREKKRKARQARKQQRKR
jgi:hypothetical protein